MQWFYSLIVLLLIDVACRSNASPTRAGKDNHPNNKPLLANTDKSARITHKDSVKPLKPYDDLEFESQESLPSSHGTKSVLFNSNGSRLYAMNLEGMSVSEFEQATRRLIKEFRFVPTKGMGWDYEQDKAIPSFEEKPVEACLSHDDKILWVSLHNAEGIVPIWLDTVPPNNEIPEKNLKKIMVRYPGEDNVDSFSVPLIKTGKTPKIISKTADQKHLLVSNWHSNTISVLETDIQTYPYAKRVSTIRVAAIPRGIVVDDRNNRSYVAIMGGASIAVINNSAWLKVDEISVASNPRHIVLDSAGRLFISYNKISRIACVDGLSGKTLFSTRTAAQPRTIILSKNQKFLFTTCYNSDTVDVFKIRGNAFSKVISLPCKGHPVGIDIFEDEDKLEAWVCSYTNGSITVFSFRKRRNTAGKSS